MKAKLRKRFLKDKTEEWRCKYKNGKCFCIFIKKAKKDDFENVDLSDLTEVLEDGEANFW